MLNQAYLFHSFGYPNLNKVKKDYDYNQEKCNRAFNLLISEWRLNKEQLAQAIDNDDANKFESTLHKFVTTLRRLNLEKLNAYLEDILNRIPIESKFKKVTKDQVLYILEEYLNYIERE